MRSRSPTARPPHDQLRELDAAIDGVLARTGAARVALVGSSRGGYAIRNLIAGRRRARRQPRRCCAACRTAACSTGRFSPGSEFNGARPVPQAPERRRQRCGARHRVPHPAQRRQRQVRTARRPPRRPRRHADRHHQRGPRAARRDQSGARPRSIIARSRSTRARSARSTSSSPAASRRGSISWPSPHVTLDGLVTGFPAGTPTNRPVADATVEVHRVAPDTGERVGAPLHRRVTGADGRWGPVTIESPGRSNSSSRPAAIRSRTSIVRRSRAPRHRAPAAGPAARQRRCRRRRGACRCRVRAAISVFRATSCCSTARADGRRQGRRG